MVKAAVYDVDGTLINSEPLHVTAWDEALKHAGSSLNSLPQAFLATMAGRKPIAIATDMVHSLSLPITPHDLLKTKSGLLLSAVRSGVQSMPGAVASAKRFHAAGLSLGIGAALDQAYVDLVLDQLGIASYFSAVVTGDQITKGKPDPETYLKVVSQLGLQPTECVVFEDA